MGNMKNTNIRVVFRDNRSPDRWIVLREPLTVISCSDTADVIHVLHEVEREQMKGQWVAGFIAYESAPGFDSACKTHKLTKLPLLWFGVFSSVEFVDSGFLKTAGNFSIGEWEMTTSPVEYRNAISRIKQYLLAGRTYQVNYTVRLQTKFSGDAFGLFVKMYKSQRTNHCAFIETSDFAICSASPELFFTLDNNTLISQPMKGTSPRGLTWEEDEKLVYALQLSPKNRAENVMIVDMVRNDMGKVAHHGSVQAVRLFEVERYQTVLQMISTVVSRTEASFPEIIKALFPCASVTGAPKIETMRIIQELETTPRAVYTGGIGWLSPERKAKFNVAIRTVWINKKQNIAEYGVGGGIVWDSIAEHEYEECLVKSRVLMDEHPDFELLETILWEPEAGYKFLDLHLLRIKRSASYFEFEINESKIRTLLIELQSNFGNSPVKVRLRVGLTGEINIDWEILSQHHISFQQNVLHWRVALAVKPIDRKNVFLYHKTTNRTIYDSAKKTCRGVDDVILWNTDGEITESTIANVVLKKNNRFITPPVQCGLLPGVFRQYLLERGEIEEEIVHISELDSFDSIYLINSVRGWISVSVEHD